MPSLVSRCLSCRFLPSVIVDDLDDDDCVLVLTWLEPDNESPLAIEAERVLAGTAASEFLVVQRFHGIEVPFVGGLDDESEHSSVLLGELGPQPGHPEVLVFEEVSVVIVVEVNKHVPLSSPIS